jgi:hypothetical protein
MDEIHNSQQPMRRQFRFASERQSDSSRVLGERSPDASTSAAAPAVMRV